MRKFWKIALFTALFMALCTTVALATNVPPCTNPNCKEPSTERFDYDATCGKYGYSEWICGGCGTTLLIEQHQDQPPTGNHDMSGNKVTAPTCTEAGTSQSYCSVCGYTGNNKITPIPPTGHEYVPMKTDAPTCTKTGMVYLKCTRCGDEKQNVIPVTDHHLSDPVVVKEGSCVEPRVTQRHCYTCDYVENIEDSSMVNVSHNYSSWTVVKPATCAEEGIELQLCSVCGQQSGQTRPVPKTGVHNFVKIQDLKWDCSGVHEWLNQCTVCGFQSKDHNTGGAAPNHNYEWVVEKQPTCTTAGLKVQICKNNTYQGTCNARGATEELPATGHHNTWEPVNKVEATCVTDGRIDYKCSACGATKSEPIPAHGHHTTAQRVVVQPTCGKDGQGEDYCSVCNKVLRGYSIPMTGNHTMVADPNNRPSTCTQSGYSGQVCSVCGYAPAGKNYPLAEHGYAGTYTKTHREATCSADGEQGLYCSTCDKLLTTNPILKIDHTFAQSNKVEPTCTQNGYIEYKCQSCGTTKQDALSSTGHNFVVEYKETFCTKVSEEHVKCTKCGATDIWYGKYAPGHQTSKVVGKQPTCTEAGYYDAICDRCGVTVNKNIEAIPAKGHSFSAWSVVTPSTTTNEGQEKRTCSVCGASETHAIPTLSPTEAPAPTQNPGGNNTPAPGGDNPANPTQAPGGDNPANPTQAPGGDNPANPTQAPGGDNPANPTQAPGGDNPTNPTQAPGGDNPGGDNPANPTQAPGGDNPNPDDPNGKKDHTGHNVIVMEGKKPTCEKPGMTDAKLCKDCNELIEGAELIPPTGHKVVVDPAVAPTLTAPGRTAGTHCEVCGKVLTAPQVIPQLTPPAEDNPNPDDHTNHNVVTIPGKEPTCEEEGRTEEKHCEDCDKTISGGEPIPPKGHNIVIDPEIPATETTDGRTEGSHCADCGKVLDQPTVIPATGKNPGDNGDGNGNGGNGDNTGSAGDGNGNGGNTGNGDNTGNAGNNGNGGNGGNNGNGGNGGVLIEDPDVPLGGDVSLVGEEYEIPGSTGPVVILPNIDGDVCPDCGAPMSQWVPTGDGEHVRVCVNKNCLKVERMACPYFYITVNDVQHHICPVCGDYDAGFFELLQNAYISKPGNVLYARSMNVPFGALRCTVNSYENKTLDVLASFTAIREGKGTCMPWGEEATVMIPVENLANYSLIRMDRSGNFEVVPSFVRNDMLVFNSDREALYLIVAAQ